MDHLLTLKFQDGTTQLAGAALVPDSVDIADAVRTFCDAPPDDNVDLPLSALVRVPLCCGCLAAHCCEQSSACGAWSLSRQ